jgi:hypothetical protein
MTPVASRADPRSVITPDAFHVAPELLGLKLASGRRRLAAIMIDLVVIGVLTLVTRSFAVVLGLVVAVALVRAGFKRTTARGTVLHRAMRASVGLLGVAIALLTVVLWLGAMNDDGPALVDSDPADAPDSGNVLFNSVAAAAVRAAYASAESLDEAESVTRGLIEASEDLDVSSPQELRTLLLENMPQDAEWAEDGPAMITRLVPVPVETVESRDVVAVRDEVSLYTTEEALEAYAAMLRSEPSGDMDLVRLEALEARLRAELAADTLSALAGRIDALADDLAEAEEDRDEAEAELDELESAGLLNAFRSWLDELGFGFGWASLYFTVMLSWWKGQTIGKRVLGMRVLRLDGGVINWWVAFERAGGYAAGFATGFLGFLQVFWDANRQMIHDRIVGTVVALDPPRKAL